MQSVRAECSTWGHLVEYGYQYGDDEHPAGKSACMRAQVEETIEVIRPALQADGGDIVLRDVDEATGVISGRPWSEPVGRVRLSTQTLKAGIERIMSDRIDGVTEVVNVA